MADNVVRQILGAKVESSVAELLGNILDVKRQLFLAYYLEEEFKNLDIAAIGIGAKEELEATNTNEFNDNSRRAAQINAIGANILSYVAIEAINKKITRCGKYTLGSTAALPRYRAQTSYLMLSWVRLYNEEGLLT